MAYLLVVEDDADARDLFCRFLKRAGHEVVGVPNGRDALSSVLARTPDLIVLDLLMPEMDGTDLVEILRSYLRLNSIPIVAVTAAPDSPQAYRARRQKVNAVLPKGATSLAEIERVINAELRPAGR
jgi:CheY-like chemotaxis protein